MTPLILLLLAFAFLVAYWLFPQPFRDYFAVVVCICAVGYLDLFSLALMAVVSVFTFFVSRIKRFDLKLFPLLIIAGALVYFKYLPEGLRDLAQTNNGARVLIPLGISYLTFRLIHYYIEQRKGRLKPHGFTVFLLWCFFVPIYTAGPIQRFDKFVGGRQNSINKDDIFYALGRILAGLLKAIAIPYLLFSVLGQNNHDGLMKMYTEPELSHAAVLWFGLFFYTFYFYLNLAGYTDLAIGASRLLGFKISENFANPFGARDFVEFWQRWHMTLGDWVKRYVFFPTAKKTSSIGTALFVAFLFVGVWHAATLNWVLWGLFQAIAVLVSFKLQPLNPLGFLSRVPRQIVASTIVFVVFSLSMSLVMVPAGLEFSAVLNLLPHLFGL